jgi:diguanylate cyclase (GGDEF)-like protein
MATPPAPLVEPVAHASQASRQRLRLRRFLFASAFSLLYLVVLAVFQTQGRIDDVTLLHACAIVAVFIAAFSILFVTGLNLRFPDPSLTAWQFLASVFTMVYVAYAAPDTRLVFTAFLFVALMFAMLRHDGRTLAGLGAMALFAFALLILLRFARRESGETIRLDLLQFLVMAVTLPWFVFIGNHVKRLQRGLSEVHTRLEDVEEQARRDELTGALNRRGLVLAMEEARQRADASGEPLSICMIDLDLFKRYNDEFDHLTGDRVLRAFAQAVQGGLRATDVFGRYGGEEFVQICRHTDLAGAVADAERLRQRIGGLDFLMPNAANRLTVSIGVAQYRGGESIMQTFARADGALYRAKQRGRNRVESDTEPRRDEH